MTRPAMQEQWSTPRRVELSARQTRGGNKDDMVEIQIPRLASCYPGPPTTGPTGPTGS